MRSGVLQLLDRNSVQEYSFVGGCGEKVTTNANQLLTLVQRRVGPELASLFSRPQFDEAQENVMWFTGEGTILPFEELPESDQRAFLDQLELHRNQVRDLAEQINQESSGSDARVYAQLIPLLLNFPEPLEYHLFRVDGRPVVTNWAMNKGHAQAARDTVAPFIKSWRNRLEEMERVRREQAQNEARERSFLGRLRLAGARHGAVTVSLIWNDCNDLDLHVVCPDGNRIGFDNKQGCGGILDIDRNAHPSSLTREPVENIVWTQKPPLAGQYKVKVKYFRRHDANAQESAYTVRVQRGGKVEYTSGCLREGEIADAIQFIV